MAKVESLNVVHEEIPDIGGSVGVTAIDKRPVTDRRRVTRAGLAGDHRADVEHHGSEDQAVYAYSCEDYGWWRAELGIDLAPGVFGENLTTAGLDLTNSVIGTAWHVGTAVLQISGPRIPCGTFSRWMGDDKWVRRFTVAGRPGAYLRVLKDGDLARDEAVEIADVPDHGVTILDVFRAHTGDRDEALLRRVAGCAMVDADTRVRVAKAIGRAGT